MIRLFLSRLFPILHRLYYRVYRIKAFYFSILFKKCGVGLTLFGPCWIKNPQNIEIGDYVSINDGVYLNGLGGIRIGSGVSISAGTIIVSTMLDPITLSSAKNHVNKPISIGKNVQLGAGSIVLAGVEIGDNVLVGAGSVVTKNLPPNCIAFGVPARSVREL